MNEPKQIYKYTHEQAVKDGELRKLEWKGPKQVGLYISRDADALFKKNGDDDESIGAAVAYTMLMAQFDRWKARLKAMHNGVEYELDLSYEIRDDDQKNPICTIVTPGER